MERKFPAQHLRCIFLGGVLVDDFLEVGHETDHITESQDSISQPLWTEVFELVQALAHTQELDGLTGDFLNCQRCTAACITIQLGKDEAAEAQATIELGCRSDRILTDHGVADEEDVVWVGFSLHLLQLTHERALRKAHIT